MNILLVSQCSKNALPQTRRILDQFAQRCGDKTWQTSITQAGLATLRKLLKQSARKNTAVACHWIHGKDHSELLWIVGNSRRFNVDGSVPTNTTGRDILREQDENNWHTAEAISILAGLAGLFHDFGKCNKLFQRKLKPNKRDKLSEPFRHEWISLRLFMAFVSDDDDAMWLKRLQTICPENDRELLENLEYDKPDLLKNPFKKLRDRQVALAIAWLIMTHHRLPIYPAGKSKNPPPRTDEMDRWLFGKKFNAAWNSVQVLSADWQKADWDNVWQTKVGTPMASGSWCAKANSIATRALKHQKLLQYNWLNDRFSIHVARLVLMLADHCYSAAEPTLLWQDKKYQAVANTDRKTGQAKQKLDEHSIGVGHNSVLLARRLPAIRRNMPAVTRLKILKKRVSNRRFRWQDKACDLARSIADKTDKQGFFGVNMASTGCGKTFANARIMYGLSNDRLGCRFNVALGLRTLTLQTGDAFKEQLKLNDEDLAVMVGSQAVRQLHEQRCREYGRSTGSESAAEMFESSQYLSYEGTLDDGPLKKWLQQTPKLHRLVSAPILISTVDYLMPATEGLRGGKQIAPMLRLLTSDLVLDEPDDFSLEDLPALCRLVNWAGLLGAKVLLASATLPPSLVQALFAAYQSGRREFTKACGTADTPDSICCAWFDEFGAITNEHSSLEEFAANHQQFVTRRISKLGNVNQPLRLAELVPVSPPTTTMTNVTEAVASVLHTHIFALHDAHHCQCPASGKKVSIGLVRIANINQLAAVAKALLGKKSPENYHVHFCVYHSQYPLLMRSHIESILDTSLNRTDEGMFWRNSVIKTLLKAYSEEHHLFVVLGTAVTEVGRDHDYDWAIAEPSSMRSLIQLAGRLQRHRRIPPIESNLLILNKNIRALRGAEIAYTKPGFESRDFNLVSKDLYEILTKDQYDHITAVPRIQPRAELDWQQNLVDLEHAHLQARLFGYSNNIHASLWWRSNPSWCGELQRRTPFRKSAPDERFILKIEEEHDIAEFYLITPDGQLIPQNNKFKREEIILGQGVSPWVNKRIEQLLIEQSQLTDMDLLQCSFCFADIRLRENKGVWLYNQMFGIYEI